MSTSLYSVQNFIFSEIVGCNLVLSVITEGLDPDGNNDGKLVSFSGLGDRKICCK